MVKRTIVHPTVLAGKTGPFELSLTPLAISSINGLISIKE